MSNQTDNLQESDPYFPRLERLWRSLVSIRTGVYVRVPLGVAADAIKEDMRSKNWFVANEEDNDGIVALTFEPNEEETSTSGVEKPSEPEVDSAYQSVQSITYGYALAAEFDKGVAESEIAEAATQDMEPYGFHLSGIDHHRANDGRTISVAFFAKTKS